MADMLATTLGKVPKNYAELDPEGAAMHSKMIAITAQARSRLFVEAALAFHSAASAYAAIERGRATTFMAAVRATVVYYVRTCGDDAASAATAADPNTPQRAFLNAGTRMGEEMHRQFAARLREALPFSALGGNGDEEIDPSVDPRGALLKSLEAGIRTLRSISMSDAPVEAYETAKVLLTSTGPLDPLRLAAVLVTYLEHLVAMCEAHAPTEEGELRRTILEVQRKAHASILQFQQLSELRRSESN
jgi:hypothetical protein